MQSQDTPTTEEENQDIDILSTEGTEGGSSNSEEVSSTEQIEETQSTTTEETTDDTIDLFKEEEKQTSRNSRQEALIEKQLDSLLETTDEDEREEILARYPKLREEVENQYSEIVGEEKIDYTAIQEENARLKAELEGGKKVSEVKEANKVLNDTLKELGMKSSEFKEKYQEEFLNEMAICQKAGISKKDSIARTFRFLGLTKSTKEAEERGKARANATIPQKGQVVPQFGFVSMDDFDNMSNTKQEEYMDACIKNKGVIDYL